MTAILHAHRPSVQPGNLLKLSAAIALTGLSKNTLRALCDSGKVATVRTPTGNHRRICRSSLMAALGIEQEEKSGGRLAILARVSTSKQAAPGADGESDLTRQVGKLRAFCAERYGRLPDAEYVEVGSGIRDDRKKLLALTRDILEGSIGTVVILYPDRLARFGLNLFRCICEKMGCTLVVVESLNKDKSFEDELVSDLLSITHSYSCKLYAKRGGDAVRVRFSGEVEGRIRELFAQGYGSQHIAATLLAEGLLTPKGKAYKAGVIRRYLLKLANQPTPEETDTVKRFIRECCNAGPALKEWSDSLYAAYQAFCERNSIEVPTRRTFSNRIVALGYPSYKSTDTRRRFKGLALTPQLSNL